jgi:hypothetical protein
MEKINNITGNITSNVTDKIMNNTQDIAGKVADYAKEGKAKFDNYTTGTEQHVHTDFTDNSTQHPYTDQHIHKIDNKQIQEDKQIEL